MTTQVTMQKNITTCDVKRCHTLPQQHTTKIVTNFLEKSFTSAIRHKLGATKKLHNL